MSVPLTVQLFDAFLGVQQGVHSILLPDVFSPGGALNVWMDKYARVRRIAGYMKQNTTAVTTNGGGSPTRLVALFPYRKTSGGTITRQLIGVFDDGVDEQELWYSTDFGVTWTFIADLGASSVGTVPVFAQFGDWLYITNGVIAPRVWDGATLRVAGRTQSPTPTATAGPSGNLLGTYAWKLVSVLSDGRRQAGSPASAVLAVQNKQVSLAWTADPNPDVVGYEIYRTSGTGKVFYYATYVDGRTTTTATDNLSDDDLLLNRVLEEHGDPPPTGAWFCVAHKQRMWYLGTDSQPQIAYYSDPGDAESVWAESMMDLVDAESQGDFITGAYGNFEGMLVVFQERGIWTISGTGEIVGNVVNWTRTKTNAQVGTVHQRTVVKIPAGARYYDAEGVPRTTTVVTLAYLTPLGDIRIFDGETDIVVSHGVSAVLATLTYAFRERALAVADRERSEVTWLFPADGAGWPTRAVTWNYRWGIWTERQWGFASAAEVESATDAFMLLAGEADPAKGGYCYRLWSGRSFDGQSFPARWMTKTLYGLTEQGTPALSYRKRWRWLDLLLETDVDATLTVEWLQGHAPDDGAAIGSALVVPSPAVLLSADGSTVESADGSTIQAASQSTLVRVTLNDAQADYVHDEAIRLRIGDLSPAGSWSLEAKAVAYQRLPGLARRAS